MDPTMLAIMAFFLLAIIITGSFVLLMPLSRQLARFLELRMQDQARVGDGVEIELRQLRALLEGLEDKLRTVSDHQEFLEKILDSREADPLKLPADERPSRSEISPWQKLDL
jgi:hypothetical protein